MLQLASQQLGSLVQIHSFIFPYSKTLPSLSHLHPWMECIRWTRFKKWEGIVRWQLRDESRVVSKPGSFTLLTLGLFRVILFFPSLPPLIQNRAEPLRPGSGRREEREGFRILVGRGSRWSSSDKKLSKLFSLFSKSYNPSHSFLKSPHKYSSSQISFLQMTAAALFRSSFHKMSKGLQVS